jgi:hypothetical protein
MKQGWCLQKITRARASPVTSMLAIQKICKISACSHRSIYQNSNFIVRQIQFASTKCGHWKPAPTARPLGHARLQFFSQKTAQKSKQITSRMLFIEKNLNNIHFNFLILFSVREYKEKKTVTFTRIILKEHILERMTHSGCC